MRSGRTGPLNNSMNGGDSLNLATAGMTVARVGRWDIGMIEFTCDRNGCLATRTYDSEEAAFKEGWRGIVMLNAWGNRAEKEVVKYSCPQCSKVWK